MRATPHRVAGLPGHPGRVDIPLAHAEFGVGTRRAASPNYTRSGTPKRRIQVGSGRGRTRRVRPPCRRPTASSPGDPRAPRPHREPYTAARDGVLATLTRPEKEQQAHAFRAAVTLRMAHACEAETRAAAAVETIQELVDCNGYTFAYAKAEHDDPRIQVMCEKCGWTSGMVCPESPAAAATTASAPAGGTTSS